MFVVLKLRRWCDSGGCSPSMWFHSSFLPSKLVDIPPPVVACLNPSFHARRGARCHLKDVTDAWLSPVRKHLDASVMKVCVKSYLRVKKACPSLHLKLWHETSNSAGEGHEWQHRRDVVIRSEYISELTYLYFQHSVMQFFSFVCWGHSSCSAKKKIK